MVVDDTKLFKPFSSTPSSHSELRDTTKELSGEDLQKIFVSQEQINFGTVFAKSVEKRSF